jgi:hypothetical protein
VSPPDNYVIFGRRKIETRFPETLHLGSRATSSYYSRMSLSSRAALSRDSMSRSTSIVGDLNGDDVVDLMIGYPYSSLCVVYLGKKGSVEEEEGRWNNMIVSFVFRGLHAGDGFGWAIDGLGDINHDGYDDIAIAAKNSGIVYILYGKAQFREVVSVSSLSEEDGYRIVGGRGTVNTGMAISNGRDFNGDGKIEIVISSMTAVSTCVIYVISLSSVGENNDIYSSSLLTLPDTKYDLFLEQEADGNIDMIALKSRDQLDISSNELSDLEWNSLFDSDGP